MMRNEWQIEVIKLFINLHYAFAVACHRFVALSREMSNECLLIDMQMFCANTFWIRLERFHAPPQTLLP